MEEENKEAVLPTAEEEKKKVLYRGTVVWFNYKTGFGYIKPDDPSINDGKDLFVHYKGISDNLAVVKEGKPPFKKLLRDQRVIFELGTNAKGNIADNVDKEPADEVVEEVPACEEPASEEDPQEAVEDTPVTSETEDSAEEVSESETEAEPESEESSDNTGSPTE